MNHQAQCSHITRYHGNRHNIFLKKVQYRACRSCNNFLTRGFYIRMNYVPGLLHRNGFRFPSNAVDFGIVAFSIGGIIQLCKFAFIQVFLSCGTSSCCIRIILFDFSGAIRLSSAHKHS